MKRIAYCLLLTLFLVFAGCAKQKLVSGQYQRDEDRVEALINYSLIDSANLKNYVDPQDPQTDDAVVIEMILDYNEENDPDKFAENNGKIIRSPELRKKMIILSYNLYDL
jgi:putative intracellular protease/amidase